jgi:hypothetical protein
MGLPADMGADQMPKPDDQEIVISAEEARQGEIILRKC